MSRKDTRKGLGTKFDVSNRIVAGELSGSRFGEGIEVKMS